MKQPDYPARLARIRGAWRIEIETTPEAARGDTVIAIAAGPRGMAAPTYTFFRKSSRDMIKLAQSDGRTMVVPLPDVPPAPRAACPAR